MFVTEPYGTQRIRRTLTKPGHIYHDSFADRIASRQLDPAELLKASADFTEHHMPDDVTRDHARRMHYAAYRMHRARASAHALVLEHRVQVEHQAPAA